MVPSLKAATNKVIKAQAKKQAAKRGKKQPGLGEVLLDYWNPSLKRAANLAIYRRGKGYVLRQKTSDIGQDPIVRQLNNLLEQNKLVMTLDGQIIPKHVYSSKSKVIRSLEDFAAIRTQKGEKGWITPQGQFFSEDVLVRQVLRGIDNLTYSLSQGISLESMYLSLSPQKRAEFSQWASKVDWDEFFKELYPLEMKEGKMIPGKPASLGSQKRAINEVALRLGKDLGLYSEMPSGPSFIQMRFE